MKLHHALAPLCLAVAAAIIAPSATAADFYLHGQIGQAEPNGSFDEDTAFAVTGGWQFSRYLALEAGYNDFGTFTTSGPVIGGPARLSADSYQLGVAAWLPFGQSRFSGFVRAGAHRWDAGISNPELHFDDSGTDAYFGVGVAAALTNRFAITLAVDRYRLDDGDIDRAMLGAKWQF